MCMEEKPSSVSIFCYQQASKLEGSAHVFNTGENRIYYLTRLTVASNRIQFTTHVQLFTAPILYTRYFKWSANTNCTNE